MTRPTQDVQIHFRANAILAHALIRRANRAGLSLSEFMRSIARERVGLN